MKAVLFDLGGVIIEINPRACFEHWAGRAGVDIKELDARWLLDEAYKAHEVGAITFAEYTQRLSARLAIELTHDDWRDGWNALFVGPFRDVAAALAAAASRIPTYCYTNTNAEHQAAWQSLYGDTLEPFEKIYVSCEIGRRKPDVDSYLWVADDMGLAPGDIMFLDDSRENIDGAAAAGFQTLHVTGPHVTLRLLEDIAG